jgi:hypothetical protein
MNEEGKKEKREKAEKGNDGNFISVILFALSPCHLSPP